MDPEALERGFDLLEHGSDRVGVELRELPHVVAVVSVHGRIFSPPDRIDRGPKAVHLRAGVVVVVLALNRVTRECEHSRERVPVGRVSCVRDVDRTGRVRRDHLDLEALPRCGPARPVVAARGEHLRERVAVPLHSDPDVDEPGPGDLRPLDPGAAGDRLRELLRKLPRRALLLRREAKRDVGRIVAVGCVGGPFELDRSPGGLLELGRQPRDRVC